MLRIFRYIRNAMAEILRYCLTSEEHNGENVFKVCRPEIMGNPFTFLPKSKTKNKNLVKVKTRDEAIDLYEPYFDAMIKKDKRFKAEWDKMFDAYLKYDTVYIGCFCFKTSFHIFYNKYVRSKCYWGAGTKC